MSTVTCMLVTSGTASIDSLRSDASAASDDRGPDHQHHAAAAHREFDDARRASSQELALEQERAVGDDLSPSARPRAISTRSPPDAPSSTVRRSNARRRRRTNTTVLPSTVLDGAARHRQHLGRAACAIADEARRDELARRSSPLRVVDLDAHACAVRVPVVDDRHRCRRRGREDLAGAATRCATSTAGRRARASGPSRRGRVHPQVRQSATLKASVARSTACPSVTVALDDRAVDAARASARARRGRRWSTSSMSAWRRSRAPAAARRAARTPACSVTALRLGQLALARRTRCAASASSRLARAGWPRRPRARPRRDQLGARLADLGALDLGEHLAALHPIADAGGEARHAPRDQRTDEREVILVVGDGADELDVARQPHQRRRRGRRTGFLAAPLGAAPAARRCRPPEPPPAGLPARLAAGTCGATDAGTPAQPAKASPRQRRPPARPRVPSQRAVMASPCARSSSIVACQRMPSVSDLVTARLARLARNLDAPGTGRTSRLPALGQQLASRVGGGHDSRRCMRACSLRACTSR